MICSPESTATAWYTGKKSSSASKKNSTAAGNLLHLLNHRHSGCIRIANSIPTLNDIHLIPGSLLVMFDSIVRNTLISVQAPLVISLYLEENDEYLAFTTASTTASFSR